MSEQRKVPKLRFPEFTEDWEQRKLSELGEIVTGSTPSTSKSEYYSDTGIPWVTPTDIESNVISKTQKKLSEAGAKVGRIVPANTILCTCIASIGKNALLTEKGSFNQQINSLTPNANNDAYFLLTESEIWSNQMKRRAASGTMQIVNKSEFSELVTMVPKFEEQKKIGSFFSCLDNLITLHQRKCDVLKKLKKGLLQKMFPKDGTNIPEIRFPEFTDAWEQRKLGDLGTTYTGLSGKTSSDFGHGEARFVTYMNVYSNPVANPNMIEPVEIDKKQNEVNVGDVFFTTSSETPEEVGMSSVLLEKQGHLYLNSFCFGYRPKQKIDPYYLAFMLRSEPVRKKIIFLAQGISRYNISKNKMMEICVPLPSLGEQKKIGNFCKNLDELITLHQRKLEVLKKLKKGLLQQMFV